MKKPLMFLSLFPSLLLAAVNVLAQGQVNFAARVVGVYDAPVFVDGLCQVKAAGDQYRVQLYAGQTRTALGPVGDPLPLRTGAAAGYWTAEARTIDTVDANRNAYVQVRAWDTAFGPTFEAAYATGTGRYGFSSAFVVHPTVAPDLPANLVGLQSFTFIGPIGGNPSCVPEPSIVLLAVLGIVPFLLCAGDNLVAFFLNFAKRKSEQEETERTENLVFSVSSVCSCKNMNRVRNL